MGNFEFLRSLRGDNMPPAIQKFPVAGSQTLVPGDLVVLSSGQIAKASASVAAPFGVMAQTSTTATAATLVEVYPILSGQVWRAVADAAATSVVLGAGTIDINSDQTVDIGDTSNGSIAVLATRSSTTDIEITFTKGYFFA